MAKTSNRTYGVEFEVFFTSQNWNKLLKTYGVTDSGDWYQDGQEVLNKIGLGSWEAEQDASIKGGDVQIEFKTPILQGPGDLKQIMRFCDVFKKFAQVNESAGVHVHVGASDFKEAGVAAERLTMALLHYKNVEDLFDSLTMAHRRGNSSYYARSPYSAERIIAQYKDIITSNKRSLVSLINSLQDERYMKMNIGSLIEHGTIEFRQMHGTLNGELVKNWIIICMAFLDTVRETEGYFMEMLQKLKEDKREIKVELTKQQELEVAKTFAYGLAMQIVVKGLNPNSSDADFKRVIGMSRDIPNNINSVAREIYPKIKDLQQVMQGEKAFLYFHVPPEAFATIFRKDSLSYGMKITMDSFKEDPNNLAFIRNAKIVVNQDGIRVLIDKNTAIAIAEQSLGVGSTKVNISKDYLDIINKSKGITTKGLPSQNIKGLSKQLSVSPMYERKKK